MVDTMVCIIGAGVAGITLAMELDRHGIDVALLESGGFFPHGLPRALGRRGVVRGRRSPLDPRTPEPFFVGGTN